MLQFVLAYFFLFSLVHNPASSRLTYAYGNTRISAGTQSAHLSHNRAAPRWPVLQARDACRSNRDCIIDTLNLEKRPSSRSLPIASRRGVSIKRRPKGWERKKVATTSSDRRAMVSSNLDGTGRSADDLPEPGCEEEEAVRRPFLAGV